MTVLSSAKTKTICACVSLSLMTVFSCSSLNAATLDRATQAGFKPHKALYDIKLSSRKSSARVANIKGKMAYEWQPGCDAWTANHHFDMIYEYMETPPVRIKSDFSTYESFDGKDFNYTSQRKQADMVYEEIRGAVLSSSENVAMKAVYSIPEDLVIGLPEGTLFPMAHTLDVLKKIRAGKKFYNATIFDGSDEEGPVDVNSFIGKEMHYITPDALKDVIDQDLVESKSWNIRLAFFPLSKVEPTSDYEMSLTFHENGVISNMDIDYADFSITQTLVALEKLSGSCDSDAVVDKEEPE